MDRASCQSVNDLCHASMQNKFLRRLDAIVRDRDEETDWVLDQWGVGADRFGAAG